MRDPIPRSAARSSRSRSSAANARVRTAWRSEDGQRSAASGASSRSRITASCSDPVSRRGAGSPRSAAASRSRPNAYAGKVRTTGSDVVARSCNPADPRLDPVAQGGRGPPAEGQHQDVGRVDPLGHPGGDALDQRGRLARARSADHEQRPLAVRRPPPPGPGRAGAARSEYPAQPDEPGGSAAAGSGPPSLAPSPPPRPQCNHAPPTEARTDADRVSLLSSGCARFRGQDHHRHRWYGRAA